MHSASGWFECVSSVIFSFSDGLFPRYGIYHPHPIPIPQFQSHTLSFSSHPIVPVSGLGCSSRRFPSSPVLCLAYAVTRDRSLQVQEPTRTTSAVTSSHFRSALQDHTTLNPASTSHDCPVPSQPSSPYPYPPRSPILPRPPSRAAEALSCIVVFDIVRDGLTYNSAFDGRQARLHTSSRLPIATWLFSQDVPSIQKIPNTP
jgi:hypothetical protein